MIDNTQQLFKEKVKKEVRKYNSSEIKALLQNRYQAPQYAFFTEVASGTGAHSGRYADAVACALWPSMGLEIQGFEIKVSRQDFINEMKHPEKSNEIMQYCHKWWLVAPKGVCTKDELPHNWGFLEVVGDKFFTRKVAPGLADTIHSPIFTAALLRRATEGTIPRSTYFDNIERVRKETHKQYEKEIEEAKEKLKGYRAQVEDWEKATGLKVFGDWSRSSKDLGNTVRWVLEGRMKQTMHWNTESAINGLREVLSRLEYFEKITKDFPDIKIQ